MSDEKRAMTKSAESPARTFNGYVMLLVLLVRPSGPPEGGPHSGA